MAIEVLQPKPEKYRAIEIIAPPKGKTKRGVLVQGNPLWHGERVRAPEADAFDVVHAGQAKFLSEADLAVAKAAR